MPFKFKCGERVFFHGVYGTITKIEGPIWTDDDTQYAVTIKIDMDLAYHSELIIGWACHTELKYLEE